MQRLRYSTMKSAGLMLLISFVGFASSVTHAATPFTTNGNFSVGSDGSASYSIPIQVPSGTAGMSPAISLNYNSNGGNGILGMGWGLDGLSQISRCPQTLVQDNQNRGVMYDTSDKMCLDGQRLISTGGTYGGNATEYRTEQANFARIISYTTTPANGPDSFKVWTKAGQIIEYGNTADSRIEAAGKTVIRTWGVNKISDTKGNYITVSYVEDNANGEAYVSRIDYTGNSVTGLAPYASVQFIYEARPDNKSQDYVAGSVLKKTKRMTNIKTYNGTTLVKDYRVTYSNTGAYSVNDSNAKNGSLITQIKECDGGTTVACLNPTIFNWQVGTNSATQFGGLQAWNAAPSFGQNSVSTGDINGDGKVDIAYKTSNVGSKPLYYRLSTGNGFLPDVVIDSSTNQEAVLGDFNGDGLADLIYSNAGLRLSQGNSFSAVQTWSGLPTGATIKSVGDINGDGKADVFFSSGSTSSGTTFSYALSTGSSFTPSGVVLGTITYKKNCVINVETKIQTCSYVSDTVTGTINGWLSDINGDGLADIVSTDASVRLTTSTGFGAKVSWSGNLLSAVQILATGDVNGDGLADIFYKRGAAGTDESFSYAYSTGVNYAESFDNVGSILYTCQPIIGQLGACNYVVVSNTGVTSGILTDLNGDGLNDLVAKNGNIRLSVPATPDFITSITDGIGGKIDISQNTLLTAGLYVPDSGSVYPVRDILPAVPLYIVSSATVSDGNGGVLTNNYSYGGLKADLKGRGSLGFRYQKVSQVDADINSTTFFRQDYPYIGLPSQIEKRVSSTNTLVNASVLSYANAPKTEGSAISQFPYLTQSVEQNFELSGSLINTTTKTNQYDGYGNATQIVVNSGDGYSKTTTNVYYNDTSNGNWLLGRLLRSTVTSTAP